MSSLKTTPRALKKEKWLYIQGEMEMENSRCAFPRSGLRRASSTRQSSNKKSKNGAPFKATELAVQWSW
jgi:hypothetical protein